jgi:hypothetical protein
LAIIALIATAAVAVTAPMAQAAKSVKHLGPATAVEMGDSYMAGLASRWRGNSLNTAGSRDGTDRACSPSIEDCETYDITKIYGDSWPCARSDVAQIQSAKLPSIKSRVNLACGGATATNIRLSSNGGVGENNEPPQADQLREVAKSHDVKFIVLGIGGNDVDFGAVLQSCAAAYLTQTTPCSQTSQELFSESALAAAAQNIAQAVHDVRTAMSQAGYRKREYTLALEDLVPLSPRSREVRYPEAGSERIVYGCPFYNADFDWLLDTAYTKLNAMLKGVAHSNGLPILGMRHAFAGHEICSKFDSEASATNPPTAVTMEWGRAFNEQTISLSPDAWHPNYYGALAQGACLGRFYTHNKPGGAPSRSYACYGAPGREPAEERLLRTGGP